MEPVFTKVYENNLWGANEHPDYRGTSGPGSEIDYNKDTYVPFLKQFIQEHEIRSVADLGCGNFKCGSLIYDDLSVEYFGYETYEKLVKTNQLRYPKYSFTHLDFYVKRDQVRSCDLCILKDVIQHWKIEEIYYFLDYLVESKKFKYILLCNCCHQVKDNPRNPDRFTPLSCRFLPLKKYSPVKLYEYDTKEVSVIDLTDKSTPIL
jgi:hypothetical protein